MTPSLLVAAWLGLLPQESNAVSVEFTSKHRGGDLIVALFDSSEGWGRRNRPLRTFAGPAASTSVVRFDDLEPGRYGIMAFHDKNRDGHLNTLPVGLPTEAYGFSRNARGMFGPPTWEDAAFEVRGVTVQRIRLR